jgi:DNA-binding NtrC family response regulator
MSDTTRLPEAGRIVVVDDNARARQSMAETLRAIGHEVQMCSSATEALRLLEREAFDLILTDLQMPGMDGLAFIRTCQERRIDAQMVMVTAYASVSSAVEAMRYGAFDYLEKPFDVDQLESVVRRALAQASGDGARSSVPESTDWRGLMVGESRAIERLRDLIAQAAPTEETVLVCGESGTGKELVARCLHAASRRAGKALVGLNCPALSPQLMESELFGHERGAFTSADAPRVGRFELAEGGTILLDEVTEIDPGLQAKLLRVLQEKTFERVGSSQSRKADVRVIATTNRDLLAEVKAQRFRHDLYFRLAVVPIEVPPLRSRKEDVPVLMRHFQRHAEQRLQMEACRLAPSAERLLEEYHWPGNVRELENVITRASVLYAGREVSADSLAPWLLDAPAAATDREIAAATASATVEVTRLEDMERRLIEATLEHFDGHREKSAQALGIGLRTLTNKLRQYGYAPRTKSFGGKAA